MSKAGSRIRFRFSVRTLLVVATLVSVVIAAATKSPLFREMDTSLPSHAAIVAAIQANGFQLPPVKFKSHAFACADFVDAPYRYPVIGWFQQRHRHYEGYVYTNDINQPHDKVTIKTRHTKWLGDLSNRY